MRRAVALSKRVAWEVGSAKSRLVFPAAVNVRQATVAAPLRLSRDGSRRCPSLLRRLSTSALAEYEYSEKETLSDIFRQHATVQECGTFMATLVA